MVDALLALVFLAGATLVAAGVWLVYRPAGVLVAGVLLMLVSALYVRGRTRI